MKRKCAYCGKEFEVGRRKKYCSRECNRNDPIKVVQWRRRLKLRAIEYLGGKCIYCGYHECSAALEFHHPNDNKDFGLSQKGVTRSWERVKKELDKCELVCKNCHAEIHYQSDK